MVIRSDRGTELGEVLCPATERTSTFLDHPVQGEILRTATTEDLAQEARLAADQEEAFAVCQELISKRRLQMNLVDVEIIFGRERIVFYYLAEKRVDFRELVKDLARALRTRIEMRQIGVRDEAKLMADYGDCGKPVCCNTHLTAMPPVSMKMAKLQKTTLDPSKISGRCGRLKCCLRYEFDTYRDLERDLPPVGSQVVTAKGKGRVVAQEILARKLVVEYEDRRRIIVGHDEILGFEPPAAAPIIRLDATGRQATGLLRGRIRGRPGSGARRRTRRRRCRAQPGTPTGEDAPTMNIRDQLARVIARDSRYTIEAYAFVLESLKLARHRKLKERRKRPDRARTARPRKKAAQAEDTETTVDDPGHVTGRELSLAARKLAIRAYGMMALTVLDQWGIRSTSDIGEIVYNLIASGDLDKTPSDKRSDFDDVFDFATALRPKVAPGGGSFLVTGSRLLDQAPDISEGATAAADPGRPVLSRTRHKDLDHGLEHGTQTIRRRLTLFLVWVATLTVLAVVSAYRPAARTSLPPEPPAGVTETLGVP